jgi:hypothetical protein
MHDDRPRRWKSAKCFGCYFPGTDVSVDDAGKKSRGMPADVEWLDAVSDLPWASTRARLYRE